MLAARFGLRIVGLAAGLAAVLAGCGTAPSQEQVEQDVDQAVQQQMPAAPTEWNNSAEAGAVQSGWIESFNDPALSALVAEAQNNNRDLAAAAHGRARSACPR